MNRDQEAVFSPDETVSRDEKDLHRLAHETTLLVAGIDSVSVGSSSFIRLRCFLHLEYAAVACDRDGHRISLRLAVAYLEAANSLGERSHHSSIAFRDARGSTGLDRRLGFVPLRDYYEPLLDMNLLDRWSSERLWPNSLPRKGWSWSVLAESHPVVKNP